MGRVNLSVAGAGGDGFAVVVEAGVAEEVRFDTPLATFPPSQPAQLCEALPSLLSIAACLSASSSAAFLPQHRVPHLSIRRQIPQDLTIPRPQVDEDDGGADVKCSREPVGVRLGHGEAADGRVVHLDVDGGEGGDVGEEGDCDAGFGARLGRVICYLISRQSIFSSSTSSLPSTFYNDTCSPDFTHVQHNPTHHNLPRHPVLLIRHSQLRRKQTHLRPLRYIHWLIPLRRIRARSLAEVSNQAEAAVVGEAVVG